MTFKPSALRASPLKRATIKKENKIVLVGGCFDVLHLGHIVFLEKAKKLGDKLVVLLESDENIKKYKGNSRPINNQENRAKMLMSLKMVDKVIKLPEMKTDKEYFALIEKIKPEIIAVSSGDKRISQKKEQAKMVGAKIAVVTKLIPQQSTSRVIEIITQDL